MSEQQGTFSGWIGHKRVASGDLVEVALRLQAHAERGDPAPPVLIDDTTGNSVSVSLHGTPEQLRARLERMAAPTGGEETAPRRQGRGRPKLGVVSREISLLPRHWEWLSRQPGGASVALRKLVEEARRANETRDRARQARDAAYRFMHVMAGDLAGFEEAIRALFAGDADKLDEQIRPWPKDVRTHAHKLAETALELARQSTTEG